MTTADRDLGSGFDAGVNARRTITEQVSTRAIEALMSNYRDAQQAFLELIDNAVDNRLPNSPLSVRIRVSRNELTVSNQGGRGLDFEGLENFFVWGYSDKTAKEIGFYGVGGKAAMGYLGRGIEVSCSAQGENVQFKVVDPSWEARDEGVWKELPVHQERAATADGYFKVKITDLKREVNPTALTAKLADIYRPLLLTGEVEIIVNGKKVDPLVVDYMETDPAVKPEAVRLQTRFGDWIDLKVGVLSEASKIKPGFRCYYRGRLIKSEEFFGHPSSAQMAQASRLIGEVDLNAVPVTANKADFIESSPQWDFATRRIHDFLKPWYEKLAKLRLESKSEISEHERESAKNMKRLLEHVFATSQLMTRDMFPGQSSGRREPSPSGEVGKPGNPRGARGATLGQTPPGLDATVGIDSIKRWGALHAWEVVSMGRRDRRSVVVEENGRKILRINADHPLYQAMNKAGDHALNIYIAETGILKMVEVVKKDRPVEEFRELVDQLTSDFGAVYQARMKERRGQRV
jgi:hypothetical protein